MAGMIAGAMDDMSVVYCAGNHARATR